MATDNRDDARFMGQALALAEAAAQAGEVPVGAVVVMDDQIIGRGSNHSISSQDPTAHAEINAIREASAGLGNYRLNGATLYVTLEPCPMCAGALVLARIRRLVFGCPDPKAGGVQSLYNIANDSRLNHQIEVRSGVLEPDCRHLLRTFFQDRR